ncbi:MAG: two-component sensor histidine kinase [Hyphomicrobiales bacterium]|nr:two-component sensor histidine kinase [Hyphomicrobiales bacterium]
MNERRALSDVERRAFAAFAEALPGPVLVLDAGGRLLAFNEAASLVLPGLREGASLPMVLRAPQVLDAVARVAAGGAAEQAQWSERVPVERVFDTRIAPLLVEGARAVVVSMSDLTEARRLERTRTDFIANASHELRTPLASVLGFIETLQGPARDDAKARERFLGIMRDQARRMARLVDDLLSLSRIERSEHLRPGTPVDLVALLREMSESMQQSADDAGAALTFQTPQSAVVLGDRDELIRVAENLIENAIKYGASKDAPARVEVTVSREGADAVLAVRDHGPGIAREHLPRLTERFYRVDAGASRAKGGTGLGLAIVKHIVVRHRGRLAIESTPGEGACFRVSIPLARTK